METCEEPQFNYNLPVDINVKIDGEFCKFFLHSLSKMFPDVKEYGEYSPVYLAFLEGSKGWKKALKSTCRTKANRNVFSYYDSLEWYDKDAFDDVLINKCISFGLMKPTEIWIQTKEQVSDCSMFRQ